MRTNPFRRVLALIGVVALLAAGCSSDDAEDSTDDDEVSAPVGEDGDVDGDESGDGDLEDGDLEDGDSDEPDSEEPDSGESGNGLEGDDPDPVDDGGSDADPGGIPDGAGDPTDGPDPDGPDPVDSEGSDTTPILPGENDESDDDPVVPEASPEPGSDFCDYLTWLNESGTPLEDPSATPDALESYFAEVDAVLDDAADAAPAEVSDDLDLLIVATRALLEALEEADWDFLAIADDAEVVELISGEEYFEASDRLTAWEDVNC